MASLSSSSSRSLNFSRNCCRPSLSAISWISSSVRAPSCSRTLLIELWISFALSKNFSIIFLVSQGSLLLKNSLDRAVDLVCSLKELLHHLRHCIHMDVRFGDDFFLDVVVQIISNISALLPGLVDVRVDRSRQV